MRLKSIYITVLALACITGSFAQKANQNKSGMYQNPVFTPDFADPTVIKAGDGWYYAYGTENTWTDGVHHIVPIIKSKNLIDWQYVNDAFKAHPKWKSEGGIWAPDISFLNGKYLMYYSFSTWGDPNPGIGLAVANKPEGPFVDQGKVFDSKSIGVANSIDPYFIQVKTKKKITNYIFWGSFHGIFGVELNDDLKSIKGEKFQIANNAFEAVYIKERKGKFYFFGSLGSCCDGANSQYRVAVAVADDIKGPYKDKNGISILTPGAEGSLLIAGNKAEGWVGPGHNSKIITDNKGNDYMFYHAIDIKNPHLPGGATRRPMMLDRIKWVKNWPEIQGQKPCLEPQRKPKIKK